MKRVVVVQATRTAIGRFSGGLAQLSPPELGKQCAQQALACLPEGSLADVGEVIVGNVLGAGHGMNISRQIALSAGLSCTTPAYTINKVCGSGLKSVALAASEIASGESSLVLAGGVESMSQAVHVSKGVRSGTKLGDTSLIDLILSDGLTDVFESCHMGITAENLAEEFSISREEQDEFAAVSQQRAGDAIAKGYFTEEICDVEISSRKSTVIFQVDEHPRPETTREALSNLRPAFKKDGTVTAGNASGINDGAAFLLLADAEYAQEKSLPVVAEIIACATGGVEPARMGLGPVVAVQKLLRKTGISLDQIDLIEANEAFAAQAIAVNRQLELDPAKTNVCGGAIALGHPIGASGARILVTLCHQLKRTGGKYGIATLCVGGGQGVAVLIQVPE
jgi:acetyl-CoA C-acetyltransferase